MRILYVGDIVEGGTCRQRMKALESLGHDVTSIHTRPEQMRKREMAFAHRVLRKLYGPIDMAHANKAILSAVSQEAFDVLWLDKGLMIRPSTLQSVRKSLPRCVIAGFSPDDMMNPNNQSRRFLAGLSSYDIYFTTKTYGVAELEALGCPKAVFMGNGYDPQTHRPMAVSAEERLRLGGDVGFIGQWEPERAASLARLAVSGVDVRVWGYTWERWKDVPSALRLENKPLWSDDYAKAVCSFKINLCFLRKCNRDLQTTRSVEIPACGGFMLAERTDEHLDLFTEGKEAEFFSSDAELLEKTKYYLTHEADRIRIAQAGYERCLTSGYSYGDRLRNCIELVRTVRPQRSDV